MADDNQLAPVKYKTAVETLQAWMKSCATFASSLVGNRTWCLLGAPNLTQAKLNEFFNIDKESQAIADASKATTPQAVAYKQWQADLKHGMHKSMVARHKGRMGYYRDDCASKRYHNNKAVSMGVGKLLAQQDIAERTNANT